MLQPPPQPDGTERCVDGRAHAPGAPAPAPSQQGGQRAQLLMPVAEETAATEQQQHVAAACRASRTPEAPTGAAPSSDAHGAGQQQSLQPAASSKHGGPFSSFQQVDLLGTLDSAAAAGTDTQLPANVQGEQTCAASRGPAHEAAAAAIDDTDAADMLLSFASADMPDSTAQPSSDAGNNEGAAGGAGVAPARQGSADTDTEGQARGAKRQRATAAAAAAGGSSGGYCYWQEVQRRLAFYGAMQRGLAGPAPDSVRAAAAAQAGFADDDEAPPPLHELPAHEAAVVRSLLHGGLPTTSGLLNGSAAGQQEQQEPHNEQQRRGSSAMSGGEQLGLLSTGSGRPSSQLLQFVAAAIVDEQQSHGSGWPGLGEAAAPAAADGQPGWLAASAGSDGDWGYAAAAAAAAGGGAAGTSNRRGGGGSRSGRSRGGGSTAAAAAAAAAAGDDGEAGSAAGKFVLRSKYTGVYRSRRTNEGWRAQFCASNKVINLGTFESEDEAARVWNEAARVFRGPNAWLNPVQPPLPPDYTEGALHLASDKAAQAVMAAAAAAKLRPPRVIVRQHGSS